ncbi:MAG: hypothetical protein ACE5GI_06370 [Candidatus Aminicenantales bacterium]
MHFLFWILLIYGINLVLFIILIIYDRWKYPVCPTCGHNLYTRWNTCIFHGKFKGPQ